MLLAWTIGCGSGTDELRSTPTTPTVTLAPPAPDQGIVWSNLASLFPEEGPALPTPLSSLAPGMGVEAAVPVLEAAREPGVALERDELGGHVVVRSVLRDWTDVAVSLVFDPKAEHLEQVNVSLPADDALAALGDRWGAPEVRFGAVGRSVFHWHRVGAPWRASLDVVARDRAVLVFERP